MKASVMFRMYSMSFKIAIIGEASRLASVQVDISALASPTMHRLQAADTAAGLSHILNLHFTNPYVLNPCSLCVQPGQHCWEVRIDIVVLNDDGGLLDACMAAASSALKSLKVSCTCLDVEVGVRTLSLSELPWRAGNASAMQ